jgi:hypothetical protein
MQKIRSIQRAGALVLVGLVLPSGCQLVAGLTSFTVDVDGGATTGALGGPCKASADCPADAFCAVAPGTCAGCGLSPPGPTCGTQCPACSQNICALRCADLAGGRCQPNEVLHAEAGPVEITCGSECKGGTFTCKGPYPCTLVCGDGCGGVSLNCDIEGACKVKCMGTGCMDRVTQQCGDNACDASCEGKGTVVQVCKSACSCSHPGCSL